MPPDDDPNTADLAADELESLSFGSSSCSRSASTASCSTSSSGPLPLPLPPRCATPSSSASAAAASGSAQAIPRIGSVSLSDIRFLRRLGAGDNGSVYLAEVRAKEKPNSGTGAGAVLLAAKVMEDGRARTEREILEAVDHPFLPRLYGVAEEEREEGWGTICQRGGQWFCRQNIEGAEPQRWCCPYAFFRGRDVDMLVKSLHKKRRDRW